MVQNGFSGAVTAPALIGGCRGARGGENNTAVGGRVAEKGERGLDLGGCEVRGGLGKGGWGGRVRKRVVGIGQDGKKSGEGVGI